MTDQQPAAGETPVAQAFDPRLQAAERIAPAQTIEAMHATDRFASVPKENVTYPTAVPDGLPNSNGHIPRKLTRQQIRELRRKEREEGVPFELTKTGITARVRDLPFTDRVMLGGIPHELRHVINTALAASNAVDEHNQQLTIETMLDVAEGDSAMANALCIAGFIWPRLVLTEHEADMIGSDDVLWVEELAAEERKAYQTFVQRNREQEADIERLAGFQGSGVAKAPTG